MVGSADLAVGAEAIGLDCSATYTVQLTAENAGGQVQTATETVTTADCGSTALDTVFANGFE